MQCHQLKMRSKLSSSSSGSLKMVTESDLERKVTSFMPEKDLFDLLIDQERHPMEDEAVLRTISELNLSPRVHSQQGCKCSKIDCLKMYCECFAKGKICSERCECTNCCNKAGDELQIYRARQMANFRHPGTFKGVAAFVPEKRCTCKKSGCVKNYCDCYRAGMKCGEECECNNCQNGKPNSDYFDSRIQVEVHA